MSIYTEIAAEIGDIVTKKNEAYGSSFAKAGEFLKLLYPHGLSVDEFEDALLLVRIFDKLMRVATDGDAFGESPFLDIAGYGILGVSLHHARKETAANGANKIPLRIPARQDLELWFSRTVHGLCSFCEAELSGDAGERSGLVGLGDRNLEVRFCSGLCSDAGHSRFAELDGDPQ